MRLVLGFLAAVSLPHAVAEEFHTSPYCWDEVRTYASGEADRIDVSVTRIDLDLDFDGTASPNGAYRFEITERPPDSNWHPRLVVFSERPYLLEVRFPIAVAISKIEWINENLIYARLWWGRAAGSDFIVDVEKEEIVYQQPIRYGAIAYQQFQQCSEPGRENEDQCRCVDVRESAPEGAAQNRERSATSR